MDGITVSAATIQRYRQQHKTISRRQSPHHLLRRCRAQFGDLIQVDGSPHPWFLGDSRLYTVLLFVDDTTGRVTVARFERSESFSGYAKLLEEHIWRFGIPVAFYSDRHSIFTAAVPEKKQAVKKPEQTQYQRVCEKLGIHLILAHSPQAKGRIERRNQTLQKRWPGEFAARGITTPEQANEHMRELLDFLNERLAITPQDPVDAHVPYPHSPQSRQDLHRLCAHWEKKQLSANSLSFTFHRQRFSVLALPQMKWQLSGQEVFLVGSSINQKQ